MASQQSTGPPYAPKTATIGGIPTVSTDVPITAVFLFLFVIAAASHMTILQLNLRKGHKFIMSGLMFGFCMARIVTCIMRIVWATRQTNVRVAIAAMIFVSAGILILLLINLVFAQRMLRAAHPHFGWHKALSLAFKVFYVLIILMLVVVITVTVLSFYTLNAKTHRIARDLQLLAGTYFMVVSFLPIPMVIIGLLMPRKTRLEKFGMGRWRSKVIILLTTSTLLCLGASFRTGTAYKNPRMRNDPAWYDARWCFYFFNFSIDIIVTYAYIILRIDRRFYVPDGSKGPGDYVPDPARNQNQTEKSAGEEGRDSFGSMGRIMSEEEVFDDKEPTPPVSKASRDEALY